MREANRTEREANPVVAESATGQSSTNDENMAQLYTRIGNRAIYRCALKWGTIIFLTYFVIACAAVLYSGKLDIASLMRASVLLEVPLCLLMITVVIKTLVEHYYVARWFCPHCGKRLCSNISWRCGFCDAVHRRESFLEPCSRFYCKAKATAYECEYCSKLTYLTEKREGRHPARSLFAEKDPESEIAIRQRRERELEDGEYQKKQLQLEIEIATLKLRMPSPKQEKVEPHQARVNWLAQQIEDARLTCQTLEQTYAEEKALLARLDSRDYGERATKEMKEALGIRFEDIRRNLGVRDIRM